MRYLKIFETFNALNNGHVQELTSDQINEIIEILIDFADDVNIFKMDRMSLYEKPGLSDKDTAYYSYHNIGKNGSNVNNITTIIFVIHFGKKIPQKRAGNIKNKYKNLIKRLNSIGYYTQAPKGSYYMDQIFISYYK